MKKIFKKCFTEKLTISFLTLGLILSGVCFLSLEGREALASESVTSAFQVETLEIDGYTEKDEDGNIVRTAPKPDPTSDYKDWIFAGWYTNATCTSTVSKTTETGSYYAKFVPSEVLSAKCQVGADTDEKTSTGKLRIVSTVDSLRYSKVGFDIIFKEKTIEYNTNKVYTKIEAAADGVKYGFSPNIFDLQSEYFITATLINIKNADFDEGILVKPYWVTPDGTKVYGVSRYARVEDSYLGIVNVPVRLYSNTEAASGTVEVKYNSNKLEYKETYSSTLLDGATTTTSGYENGYVFDTISQVTNEVNDTSGIGTIKVTASSDADVMTDGMLVNLRLKIKDDVTLPKINEFAVGTSLSNSSEESVAVIAPNVVYMNYKTGVYSGVADKSWIDKSQNTFVITTAEEFYGLAEYSKEYVFPGKTIYLGADITINSSDTNYTWPQIGSSSLSFAGTFDGQGHTISGISVNDTEVAATGYVGLFAQVNGTIKNFNLTEDCSFSSNGNMVGSVVGYLTGNMSGVSSKATVVNGASANKDKEYECGGLVGRFGSNSTAIISNCMFSGSVTSNNRYAGGIVGRIARGTKTVTHCFNEGTVTSSFTGAAVYAGGIIGGVVPQVINQTNVDVTLVVSDSLNTGEIATQHHVGVSSIIGFVSASNTNDITLENTYATNQKNSNDSDMGAIGGTTTYVDGSVSLYDEDELKGYTGYTNADFALSVYTNSNKSAGGFWVTRVDDTPILRTFAENWIDYGWYSESADVKEFEISTVQELYALSDRSQSDTFESKTIKLAKDITVNEGTASNWGSVAPKKEWTPIGSSTSIFAGTFDGQGNTIEGIYVNKTGDYAGLFAVTAPKCEIKDLRLENSYIYGSSHHVGSIAGRGNGIFDTIYSDATVVSDGLNTGGLIGQMNASTNTKIANCWFAGTVTGERVGGIVGFTLNGNLKITNCLSSGSIIGNINKNNANHVGGLCGAIGGGDANEIQNSMFTGKMTIGTTTTVGVVGNIAKNKIVDISVVYSIDGDYKDVGSGSLNSGTVERLSTERLTGAQARYSTSLGFYGEEEATDFWVAREGKYPGLKSFVAKEDRYIGDEAIIVDTSWYNTTNTEIYIDTAAKLYGLAEKSSEDTYWNDTIYLTADITVNIGDATQWGKVAPVNVWTPINIGSYDFTGKFDGQGCTIKGIYVNQSNDFAGLFGKTATAGKIGNLRLENSYFYGSSNHVGSIAGRGNGTFNTVYSKATVVSGGLNTGGLIGQMNSGADNKIENCWFDGTVTGARVGGLVGYALNYQVTITDCLVTGKLNNNIDVTDYNHIGGLFGQIGATNAIIQSSISVPDLTIKSGIAAGIAVGKVDANKTVSVNQVYGLNELSGIGNGVLTSGSIELLPESQFVGAQARYSTAMGFYGENETTDFWVAREDKYPGLKSFVAKEDRYIDDETIIVDTSWYNQANTEIYIDTAAKLYGLAEKSKSDSYHNDTVTLGADITVNIGDSAEWGSLAPVNEWTQIGTTGEIGFRGVFNGNGHTIQGMYLDTDEQYGGLFTQMYGTLSNLRLQNSYFQSSNEKLGSVTGLLAGNMSDVYSDAIVVSSSTQCGGLVGLFNTAKTISGCWFDGTVTSNCTDAQQACGGLVGLVDSAGNTIENCLNSGDVVVNSTRTSGLLGVGGLVGMSKNAANKMIKLTITDCINAGVITADHVNGVGSIIGIVDNNESNTTYTNTLALTNVYTTNQYVDNSAKYDWATNIATGIGVNVDSKATITGSCMEVSVDDRFIGYAAFDDNEQLDFENTWVLRKDGVPAPKILVLESEQCITVDTDLALSTLGTSITLRGNGIDAGDGSYVISVPDVDGTIYSNYLSALKEKGFIEYANNSEGLATQGLQNVVYTKAEDSFDWVVSVTYAGNEKQTTYVAVSTSETLSVHLKGAVTYTKDGAYTTTGLTESITMLQCKDPDNNGGSGAGFVIQLSNGHFIIHDGGFNTDLPNLIDCLKNMSNGEMPIVEAWVISHAHSDHVGVIRQLVSQPDYADDIYVQGIYYNESSAFLKGNILTGEGVQDMQNVTYNELIKRGMALLQTTEGSTPEIYRYRTGQRYTFGEVTMDVIQMEEQILDCLPDYTDSSNATSSSVVFTINGKKVYLSGDEQNDNMRFTKDAYNDTYFNNLDVYVASHHGSNTWMEFVSWCTNEGNAKFGKVLFPNINTLPPYWEDESPYTNYKLISQYTTDNNVYTYADGNVVLTFNDGGISVSK